MTEIVDATVIGPLANRRRLPSWLLSYAKARPTTTSTMCVRFTRFTTELSKLVPIALGTAPFCAKLLRSERRTA
jgi:hypothetical protein